MLAANLPDLEAQFRHIHAGHDAGSITPRMIGDRLLHAFVAHLARSPRVPLGVTDPRGHARIVARARAFIHENLDTPLSIDRIAAAAATSQRTLHRAFHVVLDETPYSYCLKLRLHRIRHELVSDAEIACTITSIANHWGLSELGRFAGWYHDLFGELPSQTLARRNQSIAALYQRKVPAFWQHPHRPDSGEAVNI
jgi:AraC-like DNA-binding protein